MICIILPFFFFFFIILYFVSLVFPYTDLFCSEIYLYILFFSIITKKSFCLYSDLYPPLVFRFSVYALTSITIYSNKNNNNNNNKIIKTIIVMMMMTIMRVFVQQKEHLYTKRLNLISGELAGPARGGLVK